MVGGRLSKEAWGARDRGRARSNVAVKQVGPHFAYKGGNPPFVL